MFFVCFGKDEGEIIMMQTAGAGKNKPIKSYDFNGFRCHSRWRGERLSWGSEVDSHWFLDNNFKKLSEPFSPTTCWDI